MKKNALWDETIKIQIYPSKKRVIPNDKISKILFNLTDEAYDGLTNGTAGVINERKSRKYGLLTSEIKIQLDETCSIKEPLSQFDCAVLSVCISEWLAENRYTTPAIILRGLTGKVGNGNVRTWTNQSAAILTSIEKLMGNVVSFDLSDICNYLNYDDNDGKLKKFVAPILPCKYKTAIINGKETTTIYFTDESPLLTVAKLKKNQLISFDAELLDVPKQQNTPQNIAVKNYVMRRIMEIKNHDMTPTITFSDVFAKCRLTDASNKTKMDARNVIIELLEHLKSKNFISDFKINRQRNLVYSVSLEVSI